MNGRAHIDAVHRESPSAPAPLRGGAAVSQPAGHKPGPRLEVSYSATALLSMWAILAALLLGLLAYELLDPRLRIAWLMILGVAVSGALLPLPVVGFIGIAGALLFVAQLMLRTWSGLDTGLGPWEVAFLLPLLPLPLAAIRAEGTHLARRLEALREEQARATYVVDPYTGLPGSGLSARLAATVLQEWQSAGRRGALVEIAITNLTTVREILDTADFFQAINNLARELRESLRAADWILQPEEDRIWVLTERGAGPASHQVIADRLGEIVLRHTTLRLTLRVVLYPDDGESVRELLVALDQKRDAAL